MRRRWLGPFAATTAALGLVLGGAAAGALPIAITAHDRSVAAEASASIPGSSDFESDTDVAAGLGPAILDESAYADVESALGSADATQTGDLSTPEIDGGGTASAFASTVAQDAFAQAGSESLLRIEFTATADALLRLTGSLFAMSRGAADAFAFVELASLDTSVDPLLVRFETNGTGPEPPFDVLIALQEGLAYRLTGLVRTNADALDVEMGQSAGGFSVRLAEVPEPGTALLLAVGVALLSRRRTAA